jgi:type IV pilus assembly protein PilN
LININLLPKNLRRVREPGYWRVLAVLFPILVLAIAGGMQYFANTTANNLQREKLAREDQLALLQPFLREQRDLISRQQQLNQLISVAQSVRQNNIVWTSEISGLLETLPAGSGEAPVIDFTSLSMQSVVPPRADPNRYEGRPVIAEMDVSGSVVDAEVLAEFIRALEGSNNYGVLFQNAQRQGEDELFNYSLTVGAVEGSRE